MTYKRNGDEIAMQEFLADMRDHKDEILGGLRDSSGKVIPPPGTKVDVPIGTSLADEFRLLQAQAMIDAWKSWRQRASA